MVAALLRVARVTAGLRKVMAAYRWVYDSRHLQADCQEPGSAPEPYSRQSSMGYLYPFLLLVLLFNGHLPTNCLLVEEALHLYAAFLRLHTCPVCIY